MSEVVTETTEAEAPKKSSKKLLIIIILAVVLLGGGGASAYFFLFSSKSAGGSEEAKEKTSKKSKAKETEEEAPEEKGDKSSSLKGAIPNDEDVKEIVELQPFIVNLADEGEARYLRLSVSLGIGGGDGGSHEKPGPLLITRVRNAMLAVLSEKKSDDVLSNAGKVKLRKELLKAAQTAAEEAHIEAIYITDFIVQL